MPADESTGGPALEEATGCCRDVKLFTETPPKDLTCPISGGVMLECRQIRREGCGHRFCEGCLVRWQNDCGNNCPACELAFTDSMVVADKQTRLRALELEAHCDHKEKGCTWTGRAAFLTDHLQECEHTQRLRCFFWMYGCDYVGPSEALDHHLLDQAQHHLQLTCERLESYGDHGEFPLKPCPTPEIRQHGGLSPEQCDLFKTCVEEDLEAKQVCDKFRANYPQLAWSVHKCLRAECDQHVESLGFIEIASGYHLWTLECNNLGS